jgi:hypothetical protein
MRPRWRNVYHRKRRSLRQPEVLLSPQQAGAQVAPEYAQRAGAPGQSSQTMWLASASSISIQSSLYAPPVIHLSTAHPSGDLRLVAFLFRSLVVDQQVEIVSRGIEPGGGARKGCLPLPG